MRKVLRHKPRKRRPFAPALEWLASTAGSTPRATLVGQGRAFIENHTGILEFSAEHVRLAARRGEIDVRGTDLCLTEVRAHALIVRGRIQSLILPSEEEKAHD